MDVKPQFYSIRIEFTSIRKNALVVTCQTGGHMSNGGGHMSIVPLVCICLWGVNYDNVVVNFGEKSSNA